MNIAELEALKAVAETGSFTRAADRLGMSQPGLSRQSLRNPAIPRGGQGQPSGVQLCQQSQRGRRNCQHI